MCGIVGEFRYQYTNQSNTHFESSLFEVAQANKQQNQRGPDGCGIYLMGNLVLGHKRLKIFDVSDRAAQPLIDHELGLALVFNGAVYNFQELREQLKAKQYKFISNSDTEVLLKAYHAWGIKCVSRLRGMFAFAIWERDSGKLILARDRLGIKPLYYTITKNAFRFASTLPALLKFSETDTTLDPIGLHYYLNFHAVPEPHTIISGIKKLSPASIMTVYPNGKITQQRYWQLKINDEQAHHDISESKWIKTIESTLLETISLQLKSDVPAGILLSGGLDSSLLVALSAKISSQPIETFSIGFEGLHNQCGDEFIYSDQVAKLFNTRHHRLTISNHQLSDSLTDCIRAMSEPMTSHDNIGFYLLSKEVSQYVKVVLSGQGADEIFAGYHWFQQLARMSNENDAANYRKLILDRTYDEYCTTIVKKWHTPDLSLKLITASFRQNGSNKLVDNALQLDSSFTLTNGPLGRVDNMTMASSLEARVPFLDETVVDLATTLPLQHKLPNNGKAILKKLGLALLPSNIVNRPKGYFPVPALKYLQGPFLEIMQDLLSPKQLATRGVFNPRMIKTLLAHPENHLTPLGDSKLWQIGLLEYWLQLHKI